MCRVQRENFAVRGSASVYCGRARAKMEILDNTYRRTGLETSGRKEVTIMLSGKQDFSR